MRRKASEMGAGGDGTRREGILMFRNVGSQNGSVGAEKRSSMERAGVSVAATDGGNQAGKKKSNMRIRRPFFQASGELGRVFGIQTQRKGRNGKVAQEDQEPEEECSQSPSENEKGEEGPEESPAIEKTHTRRRSQSGPEQQRPVEKGKPPKALNGTGRNPTSTPSNNGKGRMSNSIASGKVPSPPKAAGNGELKDSGVAPKLKKDVRQSSSLSAKYSSSRPVSATDPRTTRVSAHNKSKSADVSSSTPQGAPKLYNSTRGKSLEKLPPLPYSSEKGLSRSQVKSNSLDSGLNIEKRRDEVGEKGSSAIEPSPSLYSIKWTEDPLKVPHKAVLSGLRDLGTMMSVIKAKRGKLQRLESAMFVDWWRSFSGFLSIFFTMEDKIYMPQVKFDDLMAPERTELRKGIKLLADRRDGIIQVIDFLTKSYEEDDGETDYTVRGKKMNQLVIRIREYIGEKDVVLTPFFRAPPSPKSWARFNAALVQTVFEHRSARTQLIFLASGLTESERREWKTEVLNPDQCAFFDRYAPLYSETVGRVVAHFNCCLRLMA